MSLADATAALEGAIGQDNGAPAPLPPATPATEQAPVAPVTPEGQTAPVQPNDPPRGEHGHFAPKTPAAPVADTTSLFDGTAVNPDTLPPELQPLAKQLQAAFTQKTQALAAERQQFEQYGDPATVGPAVELYRALQDPTTLTQFHADLTEALKAQGLSPVQASAEAAAQIEQASTLPQDGLDPRLAKLVQEYPDLAPLIEQTSQVSALQARLDQFDAAQTARQESEQLAYQQMALAGELQRQEMAIMQSNPHYVQGDVDAIYELSAFFDGNLLQAQQRYEQIGQSLVDRYLSTKAAPSGVAPAVGAEGTSQEPSPEMSLEDGYKAALAYAREAGIESIGA
jgi:hypothetical protein